MKTTTIKYGLMMDGKLLSYTSNSNEGSDFCNERSYELIQSYEEDSTKDVWLVDDEITAEYVRNYSTEWYNADYETPINRFIDQKDKISVVKVEITTDITPVDIKFPTMEELSRTKYEKFEPKHLEYLLELLKDGKKIKVGVYDFLNYFDKLRKKK